MSELRWKCPNCDYIVTCFTKRGLEEFRARHEDEHAQRLRNYFGYDTLRLTDFDIGFLKTRGVRHQT